MSDDGSTSDDRPREGGTMGMTSLERVMTTIRHGIPDRVPVDLHNFLPAVHHAGLPLGAAFQDGEVIAESQLGYWRDFGHDMLLVENGVIAEAQACGCEAEYPDDRPPDLLTHILADSLERVADLEVPDPFTTHPMCEVIKAVRILAREVGDRVFIMGRADQGPAALYGALRGYEQFILDLKLDEQPELVRQTLDYCTRVHRRYAEALREAGAHGTSMGGMGVDLIGPALHRSFCHPYSREVIEAVGSPEFPYSLHICGDATLILADMVATGAQVLELDHKTDMHAAKAAVRGRTTILGNVNPVVLWGGAPSEVDALAREAIEFLAPGGEFILGPGCALSLDTPDDNVHALIESARKHGRYRPDGSLAPAAS
jgi:uroporphyrinogen decarboxylase